MADKTVNDLTEIFYYKRKRNTFK